MSARVLIPIIVGVALIALWEAAVRLADIPAFLLPAPSAILAAAERNWAVLEGSLFATIRIMALALTAAVVTGVALAFLMTRSRWVEMALFPYAVVLQVTPLVAITPLILIWVGINNVDRALVIIAWIVAFFPILSNMVAGLRSVDLNLRDYFKILGAGPAQTFLRLELPSALPHFLAGLKISTGLALIGAVVAEFVAGSGASQGLAWRILEAGNRLQMPEMFAALLLLSGLGILLYYTVSLIEFLMLRRWHQSARRS